MGPEQSGGRRRGNFLASRGMGDSPGEDKLPRRGCVIGGRGVSRPWARSTHRRGRMERSARQRWSWRRWRPSVTGGDWRQDSAISVPCSGHDIPMGLVVDPGRECSPSVRPCRWPWPWWGRLQALRRGACSGLEQTRRDPTAPIYADHGDEGRKVGFVSGPGLGAAAKGTVMPRRCSARLSGWGGTLCLGWIEQPFYGGKDA